MRLTNNILTAKGLDALCLAMLAISHQCMSVGISDSEVRALLIGAGKALGGDPLGGSPAAFHLAPGAYRRRRSPSTQRGRGGETTSRAIKRGAWFEETVDYGVCGLRCQGPEAMMSPVKVPHPGQAREEAK